MLFPMVASVSDERDAIAVRIPTQIATSRSKLPAPVRTSRFFTILDVQGGDLVIGYVTGGEGVMGPQ